MKINELPLTVDINTIKKRNLRESTIKPNINSSIQDLLTDNMPREQIENYFNHRYTYIIDAEITHRSDAMFGSRAFSIIQEIVKRGDFNFDLEHSTIDTNDYTTLIYDNQKGYGLFVSDHRQWDVFISIGSSDKKDKKAIIKILQNIEGVYIHPPYDDTLEHTT